jgi:hypothetical protein
MQLTTELIPPSMWGSNLRKNQLEWLAIKIKHKKDSCEICGSTDKMELHEKWEYDDIRYIQKLIGLVTLCSMCHQVKHFGRIMIMLNKGEITKAQYNAILEHATKINGITKDEFMQHFNTAVRLANQRGTHKWLQDLSLKGDTNETSNA